MSREIFWLQEVNGILNKQYEPRTMSVVYII